MDMTHLLQCAYKRQSQLFKKVNIDSWANFTPPNPFMHPIYWLFLCSGLAIG